LFRDDAFANKQLLTSIAKLEAAKLEDNNDNDNDNNNNNNNDNNNNNNNDNDNNSSSNNSNLLSTQRLTRKERLSIIQARRKKCREHKLNVIVNAL
jgi:hypothetical protein